MHLRIKHDGKSRRIEGQVSSVKALKQKIAEAFGEELKDAHIVYKDCDKELVNIIDDEDLKNCYSEAADLKLASVTFIVKSKKVAQRKASEKKSSSSSSESETEVKATLQDPSQPEPSLEELKKKALDDSEALKKSLTESLAKQLKEVDEKTKRRLENMEKKKAVMAQKKALVGKMQAFKGIAKNFRFLAKQSATAGVKSPAEFLGEALKSTFADCSGLEFDAKVASAVFEQASGDIAKALKNAYATVVKANPGLLSNLDQSKKTWEEFSEKFEKRWASQQEEGKKCHKRGKSSSSSSHSHEKKHRKHGHGHFHGEEHHHKWNKKSEAPQEVEAAPAQPQPTQGAPQEPQPVQAPHQGWGWGYPGAHQGWGHHKGAWGHPGYYGGYEKPHKKHHHHDEDREERRRRKEEKKLAEGVSSSEEDKKELRKVVKDLKEQFPKMDRKQLKEIVKQNVGLAREKLVEVIKNFKQVMSGSKH